MINYKDYFEKAFNYEDYKAFMHQNVLDRTCSGNDKDSTRIVTTQLNEQRMKRVEKTFVIHDDLQKNLEKISEKYYWLIIVETWCGDAAQNFPALIKIAEHSKNIEAKVILRDDNPELIDAHLTEGTRSIPKLLCFDKNFNLVCEWGARPVLAQNIVDEHKKLPDYNRLTMHEDLHKWYALNRSNALQDEINELLKKHLLVN